MLSSPATALAQILVAALLAFPATSALAVESPWVKTDKADIRLISAGAPGLSLIHISEPRDRS